MHKWEYLIVEVQDTLRIAANDNVIFVNPTMIDLYNYLNKLGREGWELVNASYEDHGAHYFFKRPTK